MSAAASARPRNDRFVMVPNELVENLKAMTHAELAFALVVMKAGKLPTDSVVISDKTWQRWTGLTPRSKELAIKGLRLKGLEVEGRGETARYRFVRDGWRNFLKGADASAKAKTAKPVRAVKPKPGAMVHPACRDRGCALLEQERSGALTLVAATSESGNAKSVSHPGCVSGGQNGAGGSLITLPPVAPLMANAKPVSQTDGALETEFSKTLAALRGFFALVGLVFLASLIARVRERLSDATDGEIAEAVVLCFRRRQATNKPQTSEGLFLWTVPDAVIAIRAHRAAAASARLEAARKHCSGLAAALRDRGGALAAHASACDSIRAGLRESADVERKNMSLALAQLETDVCRTAAGILDRTRLDAIAADASANADLMKAHFSAAELDSLRLDQIREMTLRAVDLPGFGFDV